MHTMPSLDYMGYAVVVNALPAAGNRYYSVFAIHRHVANSLAVQAPAACQQGIEDGVICDTSELAYQDARDRARNWIDAHPARTAKHADTGTDPDARLDGHDRLQKEKYVRPHSIADY